MEMCILEKYVSKTPSCALRLAACGGESSLSLPITQTLVADYWRRKVVYKVVSSTFRMATTAFPARLLWYWLSTVRLIPLVSIAEEHILLSLFWKRLKRENDFLNMASIWIRLLSWLLFWLASRKPHRAKRSLSHSLSQSNSKQHNRSFLFESSLSLDRSRTHFAQNSRFNLN